MSGNRRSEENENYADQSFETKIAESMHQEYAE
jgi:hypothetical protein